MVCKELSRSSYSDFGVHLLLQRRSRRRGSNAPQHPLKKAQQQHAHLSRHWISKPVHRWWYVLLALLFNVRFSEHNTVYLAFFMIWILWNRGLKKYNLKKYSRTRGLYAFCGLNRRAALNNKIFFSSIVHDIWLLSGLTNKKRLQKIIISLLLLSLEPLFTLSFRAGKSSQQKVKFATALSKAAVLQTFKVFESHCVCMWVLRRGKDRSQRGGERVPAFDCCALLLNCRRPIYVEAWCHG